MQPSHESQQSALQHGTMTRQKKSACKQRTREEEHRPRARDVPRVRVVAHRRQLEEVKHLRRVSPEHREVGRATRPRGAAEVDRATVRLVVVHRAAATATVHKQRVSVRVAERQRVPRTCLLLWPRALT